MKKNKLIGIFGILLLFIIILSFNTRAVGVSAPYWDENPLYVKPGEVKEVTYLLQNMIGDQDVKIEAKLEGDTSIIKFVDANPVYDVPIGRSDVPVKVIISVPSDAKAGDKWQVGVRFTTTQPSAGSPVVIGTAFSKGFNVIVGQPETIQPPITPPAIPPEKKSNTWITILILVVVLVVLWLLVSKFYKKKSDLEKLE